MIARNIVTAVAAHTLTLNCESCRHRADMDWGALVEANGES
jgi:hypothetical protein